MDRGRNSGLASNRIEDRRAVLACTKGRSFCILRTVPSKLLRRQERHKHWPRDPKSAGGAPNSTDSAVCFSQLWVLRRPRLRLRFAQPSAPQRNRSRSHKRNVPKQPTRHLDRQSPCGESSATFSMQNGSLIDPGSMKPLPMLFRPASGKRASHV